MKKIMLTLCVLGLVVGTAMQCVGCAAPDASKSTLQKAGYTDIRIEGWAPLQCSDDDTYSTGFRAKNPRGDVVEGVVCCGAFSKACTIRF